MSFDDTVVAATEDAERDWDDTADTAAGDRPEYCPTSSSNRVEMGIDQLGFGGASCVFLARIIWGGFNSCSGILVGGIYCLFTISGIVFSLFSINSKNIFGILCKTYDESGRFAVDGNGNFCTRRTLRR